MSNSQEKYLKYKNKYIELQNQIGGQLTAEQIQSLKESYAKPDSNKQQIQYCISQMKRFALCMQEKPLRKYQFFYQIGRIQELLKSDPIIWWNPFEEMIKVENYAGIIEYVNILCGAIGCNYDEEIVGKGC